ncbi:MAG: B12-binding domain-containing radical SAM protein [Candidatus Brocadia carolinensis]|uniref:B12-binding domain-containing radical SAM protein n=1 Tax=Candidatus Brocadia carolinensis TaxID=1004156 RepID=A0A1V4AVI6_9BACT|nr:MAG: B12-binding domain-containing radical SAM protein [Candidatus Brocadia caroliniensis]
MKVLLLFPPSWHPSQPYLSLPSLTAFLRQNGVSNVVQRDMNIELLDILLTEKTCREFYQKILDKLKHRDSSGSLSSGAPFDQEKRRALIHAVETIPALVKRVEPAKHTLRSEGFYDLDRYIESVNTINNALDVLSALYYPSSMTAINNDMRYSVYSSQEIFTALDDEEENIFLNLYKDHILASILESSPTIVGISITSTSQIIPGLTLAKLIKGRNKEAHITIGGSVFTKLIENVKKIDGLFSIVDSFIVFEGEHALLDLAEQVDGKRDFKKVRNLIYRDNNSIRINEPFFAEDLNKLPTPDFDDLPLRLYHAPVSVLPVQTSRGCYYRKCAFCNLHLDHRNFRLRRAELLLEDIRKLSQKYQTPYFFFTDESVPVSQLREISQGLLENKQEIKWMGGVRFENALSLDVLRKMYEAGCQKLVFGLESYNQRVLDIMKKGTKVEVVKRILDECLKVGISFHLYLIIGFPTETEKEALETLNFVLTKEYLDLPGFSCLPSLFGMEKDSPITQNPMEYGLRSIMAPRGEDLGLGYFYEVEQGMSSEEAERMYHHVVSQLSEKLCPFPYNYSMADGLLYIAHRKHAL